MKKPMAILLALTVVVALAAIAAPPPPPQQGGQRAPAGPNGPRPRAEVLSPKLLAEFLGLTEAQQEQARALAETLHTAIEPLLAQQRANREQIDAAVEAGNAQKAGELLVANYALREQIEAAHATFRTSFEALLTSEQKAKFAIYQEIVELRRED